MKYFKITCSLLLLLLWVQKMNAQSVAQLKSKVNNTQNQTQIDLRNQISDLLLTQKSYKEAQTYTEQAKAMAQKINYRKGLAKSYANLGVYYASAEAAPKETYEYHQKSFQIYKKLYQSSKVDKWIVHDFIKDVATPTYKIIVNSKKAKKRRYRTTMKSYQLLYTEMSDYLSKLAQNTQDQLSATEGVLENTENLVVQKTYNENLLKSLKSRLEDSLNLSQEQRKALKSEVLAREMKIQNDSLKILQHETEVEKHKEEVARYKAESEKTEAEAARQRIFNTALILGLTFIVIFTVFVVWNLRKQKEANRKLEKKRYQIEQQKQEIEAQKDDLLEQKQILEQQKEEIETQRDHIQVEQSKSEKLLLNILPRTVAQELKETGLATPQKYQMVTVLFTDFKGFTKLAEQHSPEEIIEELNVTFTIFDEIMEKYGMERIKTIGDAYMAAGGVPTPSISNPIDVVRAGLEMQQFMNRRKQEKLAKGQTPWELRLGVHTGEIIAGVVGKKKFAYDIWGDTVNLASRMETSGEVGKVNISEATYKKIKHVFKCTYRGEIEAKNKGLVKMYFVEECLSNRQKVAHKLDQTRII